MRDALEKLLPSTDWIASFFLGQCVNVTTPHGMGHFDLQRKSREAIPPSMVRVIVLEKQARSFVKFPGMEDRVLEQDGRLRRRRPTKRN